MKRTPFTLFLALFILSGCSKSSQPKFGANINGNRVTCSSSQKFSLDLDVHSNGGYQWFADISDTSVVKLDSTGYASKRGQQLVSGLAIATLYFRPIRSGQSTITLNERRGWEKDISPINTIKFGVLVK
jgi:predicted secreted protein